MQPTEIHEAMAGQIDHMKPAHLIPGKHVGMTVVDETAIRVTVVPTGVSAIVRYMEGPDLYNVTIVKPDLTSTDYDGVYCDQLGELIFGVDASEWTVPMVIVYTEGPDGEITRAEF